MIVRARGQGGRGQNRVFQKRQNHGTHALTAAAVAYPRPTSPQQPQISMGGWGVGQTLEIPPLSGEGVRADGFGVKDLFSLGVWDLAGGSHYSGRPHPCACGQHSFD